MSGCRHNYGAPGELDSICQRWQDSVIKQLSTDQDIEHVVISFRNEGALPIEANKNGLIAITSDLLAANKKVILVLQAPLPGAHIDKYLAANLSQLSAPIKGLSLAKWKDIYRSAEELRAELDAKVIVVDPADYFCEHGDCLVIKNGVARYFDDDHMSLAGAHIINEAILQIMGIDHY